MNIKNINNGNNSFSIPVSVYVKALNSNRAVNIPTTKQALIYANFKHVNGIPTSNNRGAGINRLRHLDRMIDNMQRLRKAGRKYSAGIKAADGAAVKKNVNNKSGSLKLTALVKNSYQRQAKVQAKISLLV